MTDLSSPVLGRHCPICHETSSTTFLSANARRNRNKIELRKCRCGFVYSATSRRDYSGEAGGLSRQTREQLLRVAGSQGLDLLVADIIAATGLRRGRALDFGCGVGLTSLCLQAHGLDVFGVECSPGLLRKHGELQIHSADALNKLAVTHFDLIVVKDVLEHVEHPALTIKQLSARLIPGGFLYVRVPNVSTYRLLRSVDTESHINHFSPASLRALLSGLTLVKFIDVYDISSVAGRLYHSLFWPLRNVAYGCHQISALYRQPH